MRSDRYENYGREGRHQSGGRPGGHGVGPGCRHRSGGPRGEAEGFGPGGYGPGFGPFGGPGGPGGRGFGPGFGPGRHGRGRGRRRRGDVRLALLLLLKLDGPLNGYQLIQGLQERSEGRWTPSPGSVYPALNQLEDEGLIRSAQIEGESGRAFELTEAGTSYVDGLGEVKAPWESEGEHDDSQAQLGQTMRSLGRAVKQIVVDGDPNQIAKATELLTQTRKDLYRILAGDDV